MKLRVAVVGWGMAGPALALALARQGHQVTAFERVPQPGPVGAGILLQPTGMTALAQLGLLRTVAERGAVITALTGRSHRGRPVMDLRYGDLEPGLFGLGIHRGVLFGALDAAARAAGVTVQTGVEILGAVAEGAGWRLDPVDQRFDLVVCADGARSDLRGAGDLVKTVRPYPWGALWRVRPMPDDSFDGVLHQVYRDTRRMVGFLPTGLGPSGNTPLVSLFWSVRMAQLPELRRRGLSAWRDQLLALAPRAEPLLDGLTELDELLVAPYFDVRMPRWHALSPDGGGLVFIGDAAHAMSPQLGQGTNLAFVDAMVLAQAIETSPSLSAALATYTTRRRAHLRYYQWASRWLTPLFQSRLWPVGPLRDLVMGPAAKLPWVRQRMLDSLAGTRTGLFSTLPLEDFAAWWALPIPES